VVGVYTIGFHQIQNALGKTGFGETQNLLEIFAKSVGNYLGTNKTNSAGLEISFASQMVMELSWLRSESMDPELSAKWLNALWVGASSPNNTFNERLFTNMLNGSFAGLISTAIAQHRSDPSVLAIVQPEVKIPDADKAQVKKLFAKKNTNIPEWLKNTIKAWADVFKNTPGENWILQIENFTKISLNIFKRVNASQEEKELIEALVESLKETVKEAVPRVSSAAVTMHEEDALEIAMGPSHFCAIKKAPRDLYCWGGNQYGQIGNGKSGEKSTLPTKIPGLKLPYIVSVAEGYTCAGDDEGVKCWGGVNLTGACENACVGGQGVTKPTKIAGIGKVRSLSAGPFFVCGVESSGRLMCWGKNLKNVKSDFDFGFNQTGGNSPQAVAIPGATNVSTVKVNYGHACYLTTDGSLFCWGNNSQLQLGLGESKTHSPRPERVLTGVESFDLFPRGGCAILKNDKENVKCWGRGSATFVHNGRSPTPQQPDWAKTLEKKPLAFHGSSSFMCLLDHKNAIICWDSEKGLAERRPISQRMLKFSQVSPASQVNNPLAWNVCFMPINRKARPMCLGMTFPKTLTKNEKEEALIFEPKPLGEF
jgi:alpha-tubulin suppressor-like RCC1 family protein